MAKGLRRISDVPEPDRTTYNQPYEEPCYHPEHNVPGGIYLESGVYEYTCPSCGRVTQFTVNRPTCGPQFSI